MIRRVFGEMGPMRREAAIRSLCKFMGVTRLSARRKHEIDNALKTASRRGIVEKQKGRLALVADSIDDYDRDFLSSQLLSSLPQRKWTERDLAARNFARWMGYARTGTAIKSTAKALINSLSRRGKIQRKGSLMRKV